ncbi:PASTA domain-containing protein [Streptomyces sp. NRRL S-1448]|uniref:PASTA domain-containing protein n=1 Tax=Streptomyces sp. NRRL S-1448 TaxID=1463883 RepID=UPI00068EC6CE|nr:PASTA domain-containing protein [Streptomyces sp. NRRL S-1448]
MNHTHHSSPTRTALATATAATALAVSLLGPAAPARADGRPMPDVTGKNLVTAYGELHYNTAIQFRDGRGAGRLVLWPASWKVCGQDPAPGTPMDDRKITLTVVKATEECAVPAA